MENEKLFSTDCIRTFTGKYLDVFNPDPEQICIEDIAHALANTCRFSGHTREFYSVAEHSINVAKMVSKEYALQGLLHDAAEAYLTDIPTPIKKRLPEYIELEKNLLKVIALKFGFDSDLSTEVKEADKIQLKYEWNNYVIKNSYIPPINSISAKYDFITAFNRIKNNMTLEYYGRR